LKPQYAGIGETCPPFTVTVESGGSLVAGTKYFSFQLQNRCGFNVPSVSSAIAITANQRVKIVIPESARKAGWDIHYFVVSCGISADASTHVQIARVPGYQFGIGISPQSVLQILPYTLYLSSEAHIALAPTVADTGGLPVGSDRLDGQVRFITSLGSFAEYRSDSALPLSDDVIPVDIGQWVRVGSASTNVVNTEAGVGCDRNLTEVNPVTIIPTPPYPAINRVLPDWEAKYWLVNDTTSVLPAGTEFGIELSYNEKRSPDLLAGLFMVRFLGFVDISTGEIRTEDVSGNDFPGIGGYYPWNPKRENPFSTIDDLQPGEAIALGVKPFFSLAELNNEVSQRAVIGIVPVIRTQSGDYNPLGKLIPEGVVYAEGDRYRVVPGVGLSGFILSGMALVGGYDFPIKPRRGIFGFAANTANQKVVINGNGAVFAQSPSSVILASEALRALVGTVAGISSPGAWSDVVAIASGNSINIAIAYPCDADGLGTIRADYPDVVKGNSKGAFNPPKIRIYLQRTDTNEIREFTGYSVIASETQVFNLTDWEDGAIITAIPENNTTDFSLYAPGSATISSTISGSFPSASYRGCYAFEYDGNQITSIRHESPPCITEFSGNFAAIFDSNVYIESQEDSFVNALIFG
jgi:hypothetical protein